MTRAVHRAGFRPLAFASRHLLLRPAALKIAASIVLTLLALGLYSLSRGSYPLPAPASTRAADSCPRRRWRGPCWRRRRWASSRALFCLISACRGS